MLPSSPVPSMLLQWGHDPSGHGETSFRTPTRTWIRCFNGAMTFRSWRDEFPHAYKNLDQVLQWGHDLPVMERGDTVLAEYSAGLLQWGHDLPVMERPHTCGY